MWSIYLISVKLSTLFPTVFYSRSFGHLEYITGTLQTWIKDYLINCHRLLIILLLLCFITSTFRCPRWQHSKPFAIYNLHQWHSLTIQHSQLLKFADDTNCFRQVHITDYPDQTGLQDNIDALTTWCIIFSLSKSVYLSFKCKTVLCLIILFYIATDSHKDLGLVLSEDLVGTSATLSSLLVHTKY